MFLEWLMATWSVMVASAPWLMFGFFVAGLLHVFIPTSLVKRNLAKPGLGSVVKSSIFGIPLPLCSCSVIPVGVALRRAGASKGATASFMVSTPEIGADSFLLSYALLGPFLAFSRVVAALVSALTVGFFIDLSGDDSEGEVTPQTGSDTASEGCCAEDSNGVDKQTYSLLSLSGWKESLRFGYIEFIDDLAVVLTIGFLVAGAAAALLPDNLFEIVGLGFYASLLVIMLISLPVYVCATSMTPFAAALLGKGFPPGAVLVFLLAGPATNITTMLVVRKELGGKALAIYLGGIALVSVVSALLVEALIGGATIDYGFSSDITHMHAHASTWSLLMALALTFLLLLSISRRAFRCRRAK